MIRTQRGRVEQVFLKHVLELCVQLYSARGYFKIVVKTPDFQLSLIDLRAHLNHDVGQMLGISARDLKSPHIHYDTRARQIKGRYYATCVTPLFGRSVEDDFVLGRTVNNQAFQWSFRLGGISKHLFDLSACTHVVQFNSLSCFCSRLILFSISTGRAKGRVGIWSLCSEEALRQKQRDQKHRQRDSGILCTSFHNSGLLDRTWRSVSYEKMRKIVSLVGRSFSHKEA